MFRFAFLLIPSLLLAQLEQDRITATIGGKPVKESEVRAIMASINPQTLGAIGGDRKGLLRYYAFLVKLQEIAEKQKLDQTSPIKEKLALTRAELLAAAAIGNYTDSIVVTPEAQEQYYKDHLETYRNEAAVRVIIIPFTNEEEENAARAAAEKAAAEAAKGADFEALVKTYSKDADTAAKHGKYGPILRDDNRFPQVFRTAIFSMKPGETTGAIRLDNSYCVARADEIVLQPYEKVKNDLLTAIKNEKTRVWRQGILDSIDLKLIE